MHKYSNKVNILKAFLSACYHVFIGKNIERLVDFVSFILMILCVSFIVNMHKLGETNVMNDTNNTFLFLLMMLIIYLFYKALIILPVYQTSCFNDSRFMSDIANKNDSFLKYPSYKMSLMMNLDDDIKRIVEGFNDLYLKKHGRELYKSEKNIISLQFYSTSNIIENNGISMDEYFKIRQSFTNFN